MKNTILKYTYDELDEFIAPDYFSKKISIYDLVAQYSGTHFDVHKITDNDKLERISYELYGTSDYWDILLLINDRNPLFQMPYEYDLIQDYADNHTNSYMFFTYSQAPLTDPQRVLELSTEFNTDAFDKNEGYRYIYVIKPKKMGEFIKIMKDNGYL